MLMRQSALRKGSRLWQPDVRRYGPRRFVLVEPWVWNGIKVVAGFVCNLASIPRLLWWIVDPLDLGEAGALLHDWLYKNHGGYMRAEADRFFLEIMLADGVTPWRAQAAYRAVRMFGGVAWHGGWRQCARITWTTFVGLFRSYRG